MRISLFLAAIVATGSFSQAFAKPAETLIFCIAAAPSAFNPQLAGDGPTVTAVMNTIYNRLVEFKPGTMDLVPGLAERWAVSKDDKEWTFFLRKGVKWQETDYFKPTRTLTASDVVFSFERQLLESHPFHSVSGGTYPYLSSMGLDRLIREVKALDDHTVRFSLNSPSAPFLSNLTMGSGVILSEEYARKLSEAGTKEDIDQKPVGTGPFSFIKYEKDAVVRYQAHLGYFRGLPKARKLLIQVVPESGVRLQKLRAKECDIIDDPAPADFESIRKEPGLRLASGPSTALSFLNINTYKTPYDDVRVRQAILHALDRESYVKAIYLGNATVAGSVLPPTLWSHEAVLPKKSHDPEKSKRLLKEAGHPDGFKMDLWYISAPRFYNPNGKALAEMMQSDLAKVGIEAKLVSYDWGTYIKKLWEGEHSIAQSGWVSDNGDPDNYLYLPNNCGAKSSGARKAAWCNARFEEVLLKAQRISDKRARTQLYREAQRIFGRELPWIPIAFTTVNKAMSVAVKGYVVDPSGTSFFDSVYKEP